MQSMYSQVLRTFEYFSLKNNCQNAVVKMQLSKCIAETMMVLFHI